MKGSASVIKIAFIAFCLRNVTFNLQNVIMTKSLSGGIIDVKRAENWFNF